MCRVLIGQSYLIAWVWILAIAIAIGPLLIRPITKNYLCYRISGWSIFWLVEIIKYQQQCCHLLIGPVIITYFASWKIQLLENGNRRRKSKITQSVLFFIIIFKNVVYYELINININMIKRLSHGNFNISPHIGPCRWYHHRAKALGRYHRHGSDMRADIKIAMW